MDLIDRGAAFFSSKRNEALTLSITYARSGQQTQTINATYAENQRITEDATTQVQVVETNHDFLLRRVDIDFGGGAVEPEKGDRIVATIRGRARMFDVMGLQGIPVNENPDPYGYDVRVHTQEVT